MAAMRAAAILFAFSILFGAATPATAQVKKIAVLTPEQGTDFGWNQQGTEAAKAVAKNLGLELEIAGGLGYGDVRPIMRELAAEGVDRESN